jgi:hypothetical protein
MAKNIAIAILSVLTLMSFTFAFYQRTLTNRAIIVAEANAVLAETNANQARAAESEAMAQRQLAHEQMAIANAQYERAEMARLQAEETLQKGKKK